LPGHAEATAKRRGVSLTAGSSAARARGSSGR
jgi:hypothetical protein